MKRNAPSNSPGLRGTINFSVNSAGDQTNRLGRVARATVAFFSSFLFFLFLILRDRRTELALDLDDRTREMNRARY